MKRRYGKGARRPASPPLGPGKSGFDSAVQAVLRAIGRPEGFVPQDGDNQYQVPPEMRAQPTGKSQWVEDMRPGKITPKLRKQYKKEIEYFRSRGWDTNREANPKK